MMQSIPRYGTGNTRAELVGQARPPETYSSLVRDTPTSNGFRVIPGLFSHGIINMLGKDLGATPNGRHAHAPIAHSADPRPRLHARGWQRSNGQVQRGSDGATRLGQLCAVADRLR